MNAGERWWRRSLDRTLLSVVLVALVITAASYASRGWWIFELFTHFRLQLAAGAFLLLAIAALRRRHAVVFAAGLVVLANSLPLLPYVWPASHEAIAGAERIRILLLNVSKDNDAYQRVVDLIESEEPDIIGLLEVDEMWIGALSGVGLNYAFQVLRPEEGAYGIAMYSRLALRETDVSPYLRSGFQSAIVVDVQLPAASATMVLAHFMAPVGRSHASLRNKQIAAVVDLLNASPREQKILAGDLNVTPWSPYYSALEKGTGVANAARGKGYKGTWPAWFTPLRIPIDHCLLSAGLRVARVRAGPDIGSDHLPLIVDIVASDNLHRVNSAE